MTWFSLPATQTEKKGGLCRRPTARRVGLPNNLKPTRPPCWPSWSPRFSCSNSYSVSPRERFKTIEVLRKTLFAVTGECQRRYENKPLPLPPTELSAA